LFALSGALTVICHLTAAACNFSIVALVARHIESDMFRSEDPDIDFSGYSASHVHC
jgi:hypothetical protein